MSEAGDQKHEHDQETPSTPFQQEGEKHSGSNDHQSEGDRQPEPQREPEKKQQDNQGGGLADVGNVTKQVDNLGDTAKGALGGLTGGRQGGGLGDQALGPLKSRRKPLANELADTPPEQQPGGGKSKEEKGSLRINISLDLDVEVHLTARIKGDITIGLL
ncbi:hypothetical protein L204_103581 [Cryptococcus depauperatus]|nr:hypothetical protein L204_01895 [Cryptococcus depauperatus CBS 7855]